MAFIMLASQNQSLLANSLVKSSPSIDATAFNLDENEMNAALADLNELDAYLSQNEGVTYADLYAAGSDLIKNVSDISSPLGMPAEGGDSLMGIPAFWWGCVLGWVGLLLVYVLTDQDKEQTKKAFTGCLISSGVAVVFYIIYAVWIVAETNALQ